MLNGNLLYDRLIESGIAGLESIIGCSPEELDQIQSLSPRPLPKSYLDFMARFGKKAGRFMYDISLFYPSILKLNDLGKKILDWNNEDDHYDLKLPEQSFVFAVRQGELIMFFDMTFSNEEYPIMYYREGDSAFTKDAECFWEFIESYLVFTTGIAEKLKETPFMPE